MKASMTENGIVVLTPETGAESYALQRWEESAVIGVSDPMRNETFYYRGSSVLVGRLDENSKVTI